MRGEGAARGRILITPEIAGGRIVDKIVFAGFSCGDQIEAQNLRPADQADEQTRLVAIHCRYDTPTIRRELLEARTDNAVEFLCDQCYVLVGLDGQHGVASGHQGPTGRFDYDVERQIADDGEV